MSECRNILYVRGAKSELRRFKKFAATGRTKLDEKKFIPPPQDQLDDALATLRAMPEEERRRHWKDSDGAVLSDEAAAEQYWWGTGGYQWCFVHWGTEGICSRVYLAERSRQLRYRFLSLWGAPIAVVVEMSRAYPTLQFTLEYEAEEGEACGQLKVRDGSVLADEYRGAKCTWSELVEGFDANTDAELIAMLAGHVVLRYGGASQASRQPSPQ